MTEPRQDIPTDPQLSRLYHEHALDEPSAAIDQRILAAARQAVEAHPPSARRTGWWQRWRMPLTLLTTVMLTVTLALLVERQPRDIASAPSPESAKERAVEQAAPVAPGGQLAAPATRMAPPPVQDRAAKPRVDSRERDASRAANIAADLPPAAPPVAAKTESAAPAASEAGKAVARSERQAAPAAAPATAGALAKSRADSTRNPDAWLEEIRALRRAGKVEEAERQLREFRLAHPDYLLPEEFRQ